MAAEPEKPVRKPFRLDFEQQIEYDSKRKKLLNLMESQARCLHKYKVPMNRQLVKSAIRAWEAADEHGAAEDVTYAMSLMKERHGMSLRRILDVTKALASVARDAKATEDPRFAVHTAAEVLADLPDVAEEYASAFRRMARDTWLKPQERHERVTGLAKVAEELREKRDKELDNWDKENWNLSGVREPYADIMRRAISYRLR